MSVTESRTPRPMRRATQYTFVAEGGSEEGISVGDEFVVEYEGEEYKVKVVDVSEEYSVLERIHTGLSHYGNRSLKSLLKRLG